jgi:hypothetical protein
LSTAHETLNARWLAVRNGDDPEATFASLKKNQPLLFGAKPKQAKPATALPHWDEPRKKEETPRRNERRWQ